MSLEATSAPFFSPALGARLRRPAWILLFLIGLFFWIPVVVRAKLGASSATNSPAAVLPVLAAQAPAGTPSAPGNERICLTGRLALTTTILGKTRRAAIVNGRLYREGDKIVAGRESYRLAAVAEDRVELVGLGQSAGAKRRLTLETSGEPVLHRPARH